MPLPRYLNGNRRPDGRATNGRSHACQGTADEILLGAKGLKSQVYLCGTQLRAWALLKFGCGIGLFIGHAEFPRLSGTVCRVIHAI